MTLICYRDKAFRPETVATIDLANEIIEEYELDGYSLTLRQLYYQFVARGLIENTVQAYNKLGTVVNNGRMAGLISWAAIEDRTRNAQVWQTETDVASSLKRVADGYALDPWKDQPTYVEIWVEKEALSGVVDRIADKWHCTYMACRGYMSQSEQWAAGQRFLEKHENGQNVIILHLGDHDPSGIDMTRDNQDRLELFSLGAAEVWRLALNMPQIEELKPPPNPAKTTDSRSSDYIAKFGTSSWELDALEPSYIEIGRAHV